MRAVATKHILSGSLAGFQLEVTGEPAAAGCPLEITGALAVAGCPLEIIGALAGVMLKRLHSGGVAGARGMV